MAQPSRLHAPVESVHLCDYPTGDAALIDEALSVQMGLVREIVSLGLSARMGAKLKVRQPLAGVEVVLADRTHLAWLEEHAELICGELNVKKVDFADRADHYINYTVLPDLKRLGPRLGKRLPAVKKLLAEADGGRVAGRIEKPRQGHFASCPTARWSSTRTTSRFGSRPRKAGRPPKARPAWSCFPRN